MKILTLACWSNSLKYQLICGEERRVLAGGTVERIAVGGSFLNQRVPGLQPFRLKVEAGDHAAALGLVIAALADPSQGVINEAGDIAAVGHRVVHGGEKFCNSVAIDAGVLGEIRKLHDLAPQHCAANVAGIEAALELLPNALQVAIFDTAFHMTMPEAAYIYPLPYEWYSKYAIRRYGFHGPAHLYLSRRAAVLLGKPVHRCNLITVNLDRGVSLCAIKNGLSIDTSMGMTPLEGSVMETRCGDIDPGIHAYVMRQMDLSGRELDQILNQKSGILGICGQRRGRRRYLESAAVGDSRSRLALEMETYRIRKYIGAYLAVIGPLDGIVFTCGSGAPEAVVRDMVLAGLDCFGILLDRDKNSCQSAGQSELQINAAGSSVRVFVIPANEELVYVEDVAAIYAGVYGGHQEHDYFFARSGFVPSNS